MRTMAHLTLLLFMLWLGSGMSSALHRQRRLIGGKTCEPQERHYHVKLIATDGSHQSSCGGSLIDSQWILTAAHCWEPGWTIDAILDVHPGPGTVQRIKEQPLIFTEKDINNKVLSHDIMLLKLPVKSKTKPIALPPDCGGRPPIGALVQMAGHAATQMGKNNARIDGDSTTLQCVDSAVVDCKILRNVLKFLKDPSYQHQHWFCVQSSGTDACPGDSGGGVVYSNMIYGIISFTGDELFACSKPAGILDVCSYINWIKNTVANG